MKSLVDILQFPLDIEYRSCDIEEPAEQSEAFALDICILFLTSGTATGIPKGVLHTHNTWLEGETVTFDDMISLLRGKIQTRKLPEKVEIMREFPMTNTGKVIKAKLREHVAGKVRKEGGL